VNLPCTPSTAATALESTNRCSKLVEVSVKADAELLITPYKAELSETPNLLCVQRKSCFTCYSMGFSQRRALAGDQRDIVIVVTYLQDRCLLLKPARPARCCLETRWAGRLRTTGLTSAR
jgi:hypothetical protein